MPEELPENKRKNLLTQFLTYVKNTPGLASLKAKLATLGDTQVSNEAGYQLLRDFLSSPNAQAQPGLFQAMGNLLGSFGIQVDDLNPAQTENQKKANQQKILQALQCAKNRDNVKQMIQALKNSAQTTLNPKMQPKLEKSLEQFNTTLQGVIDQQYSQKLYDPNGGSLGVLVNQLLTMLFELLLYSLRPELNTLEPAQSKSSQSAAEADDGVKISQMLQQQQMAAGMQTKQMSQP